MSMGFYWTSELMPHDCEVTDINGSLAYVHDLETGEDEWVPIDDVQPAAIDDWYEENSQFGVGA